MKNFLCICFSSTLQKTVTFPGVKLEAVNRSEHYRIDASGKAVNAARVLAQLEKNCVSTFCPLGENDYEWKYVGVWGDMLEEDFKIAMKKAFSSDNITELFVAKGEYESVMAILQENLRKRNEYNQEEANKKK